VGFIVSDRRCGGCSACCEALPVEAVKSARYERCAHQRRGYRCCSIYSERPKFCIEFKCSWLRGEFAIRDRPDKIGCVVTRDHGSAVGVFYSFREIYDRSFDQSRVMKLIQKLRSRNLNVVVIYFNGERKAYGSDEFLKNLSGLVDRSTFVTDSYPKHL
jgi:hypothetical protein